MIANNLPQSNGKVSYDGRTYQTVAYRLSAFRQQFPADSRFAIETQCLHYDADHVIFKATIKAPDGQTVATGHAFERWNASPLNQTSAYENAETSAIGRALAAAGFIGSEFATADELTLALQAQGSQAGQNRPASQAAAPAQSGKASTNLQHQHSQPTSTPAKPQARQTALPAQAEPAKQAKSQAAAPTQPKPTAPTTGQTAASRQAKQSGQAGTAEQGQAATKPDEQLAEKWTREHLAEWLDQPCQFGKACGRTWRELAENRGEKIEVKGRPCQPRAYLHALESWASCGVWQRMKAKVALELGKNGTQQATAAR